MRKSTIALVAAATLLCGSAQAQKAMSLSDARSSVKTGSVFSRDAQKEALQKRYESRKAAKQAAKSHRAKAPLMKAVPGPDADMKLIDETPAGTLTGYLKEGSGFGYNWLYGLFYQNIYGGLNNVVKSDDGKKLYIQNPIFFNYFSESNWIEGDVDGDVVTFTFPQLIAIETYEYDEDDVEIYYDYALRLEYEEDEEGGWYYPSDNQEYSFKIGEDGSLVPLEKDSEAMIGFCAWFDEEDIDEDEEPLWAWQGNGDFITSIKPNTNVAAETPADVEFADWKLMGDISYRSVNVGMKDDKVYVKGFFASMPDAVVEGKVDGSKITFPSGQYLGEYENGGTVAFFLGGNVFEEEPDEDGYVYKTFKIGDSISFDYDKGNNVIKSDAAYCISCSPEKILYYVIQEEPYICIPPNGVKVTQLLTPQLTAFYDANDNYGWDAEFYFDFPTIDKDRNILDTSKLFYEVIMDDEVFTFYDDEYELPEGVAETTEIPFDYESENTYDFSANGTAHCFEFKARGFESLGVRTLYKADADNVLYSDILWAPGYEGTMAVKGISADKQISSVRYFDINGVSVARPGKGVYVMQTVFSDGTSSVRKVMAK